MTRMKLNKTGRGIVIIEFRVKGTAETLVVRKWHHLRTATRLVSVTFKHVARYHFIDKVCLFTCSLNFVYVFYKYKNFKKKKKTNQFITQTIKTKMKLFLGHFRKFSNCYRRMNKHFIKFLSTD